jgi:phosphatidylglycerophosphatase A
MYVHFHVASKDHYTHVKDFMAPWKLISVIIYCTSVFVKGFPDFPPLPDECKEFISILNNSSEYNTSILLDLSNFMTNHQKCQCLATLADSPIINCGNRNHDMCEEVCCNLTACTSDDHCLGNPHFLPTCIAPLNLDEIFEYIVIYGTSTCMLQTIPIARCNSMNNEEHTEVIIIIAFAICFGFLLIIVVGVIVFCIYKRYKKNKTFHIRHSNNNLRVPENISLYTMNGNSMNKFVSNEQLCVYKEQLKKVMCSSRDIHYIEEIGEGAFGKVYKGIWNTSNGEITVAIKTILKVNSIEEVEEFVSESAVMLDFDHPNVLKLLGVCFDTDDQLPVIILPYMASSYYHIWLMEISNHSSSIREEIMNQIYYQRD